MGCPQGWASLPAMRWEKLFAELESQAGEDALFDRDALIDELREGERAATSWQQLCGGEVSLTIAGLGRVDGLVLSSNAHLLHVRTGQAHLLINPLSVLEILSASRRSDEPSRVAAKLGWAHAFRLCHRDQERVKVIRMDSSIRAGLVAQVGLNFVQIRDDAGWTVTIPFAAVAAVSCPR